MPSTDSDGTCVVPVRVSNTGRLCRRWVWAVEKGGGYRWAKNEVAVV